MILSRGLFLRLDGAWWLAATLFNASLAAFLTTGIMTGISSGGALAYSTAAVVLWAARGRHSRHALFLSRRAYLGRLAGIAMISASAILFFAIDQSDPQFSHETWWRLIFDDDVPAAVRAATPIVIFAAGAALWWLLSPSRTLLIPPDAAAIDRAGMVAATSRDSLARLALHGDKHLLFSEAGDAFIMFRRVRRHMVALGDPTGNPERFKQLVWDFREFCHRNATLPVFYHVGNECLPLYLDLGLRLEKLGTEARVFLPDFTLDGRSRRTLRRNHRRCARRGAAFQLIPPDQVDRLLSESSDLSGEWSHTRSAERHKPSFTSKTPYLRQLTCCGVVQDGRIVAFAAIWASGGGNELCLDMIRNIRSAPNGVVDYLLVELILWGHLRGYRWLSLGVVPLSRLKHTPPVKPPAKSPKKPENLHKATNRQSDEPANPISGILRHRNRFGPQWRPRFIAWPYRTALYRIRQDAEYLFSQD